METDSSNNEESRVFFKRCVGKIKSVNGMFCELGLRKGGGSELFMKCFL